MDWSKLTRNMAAGACCAGTHKNIGFCSLNNQKISHSNSKNADYEYNSSKTHQYEYIYLYICIYYYYMQIQITYFKCTNSTLHRWTYFAQINGSLTLNLVISSFHIFRREAS